MGRGLLGLVTACLAAAALAEPEFADSAPLTTMWQAISVGNTDQLIDVLVQAHEYGLQRAADGRGPLFWAYEFKCVDALALLTHVGADEEAEDLDGKRPREFFPGTSAELDGIRLIIHLIRKNASFGPFGFSKGFWGSWSSCLALCARPTLPIADAPPQSPLHT